MTSLIHPHTSNRARSNTAYRYWPAVMLGLALAVWLFIGGVALAIFG